MIFAITYIINIVDIIYLVFTHELLNIVEKYTVYTA